MTRILALTALALVSLGALENPATIAKEIRARQQAEWEKAAIAWLETFDAKPLPVPKLGPDPRDSERREVALIEGANGFIESARKLKERIASGDKTAPADAAQWFWSMDRGSEFVDKALTSRR